MFPKFLNILSTLIRLAPFLAEVIFSNVTLLRDVLDYIQRTDESAILVSLDQEKAFDSVNRSFSCIFSRFMVLGPSFAVGSQHFTMVPLCRLS